MTNVEKPLRVLELYSGIGGMQYGFIDCGIDHTVVAAIDINTTANTVYKHNFPSTVQLERNIQSLTREEIDLLSPSIITMSPPCQPFTRIGLKQDSKDVRTESLFHVLELLPNLNSVSYILVENVKGFETSVTRNSLVEAIRNSGFIFQEFLLNPNQFGIPNSRLRYYLLAKRKPLKFCFDNNEGKVFEKLISNDCQCISNSLPQSKIGDYLETNVSSQYLLPDKVLETFADILDIVDESSIRSCCFTKGYNHYVKGTGSVLHQNTKFTVCEVYKNANETSNKEEKLNILKKLELRYFTPREISNLMGFPSTQMSPSFSFPDSISDKQRYRVLGNSVSVKVISQLIKTLICNQNKK